jgi:4-amino-4-deoxy-L-arabinose transferase-like glycosyltransferase
MGADFIRANRERSIWLFILARWACIPFSVIGGLICFVWSRELWRSDLAGVLSLTLWSFDPNILAHGELITPDCAATSFGLGATYMFWRWLRRPTWRRSAAAGLVLGLAVLTKLSWIILFGLWPLIWIIHALEKQRTNAECRRTLSASSRSSSGTPDQPSADRDLYSQVTIQHFLQLAAIITVALYVLNLGYGFDGTCTRLRNFTFVSHAFTGVKPGEPGNRFAASWTGSLPVPVPKQYLRGIDLQKKDFEDYGRYSYLRGEWKDGGWWYYYLYGLVVKMPHGTQLLLLLALSALFSCGRTDENDNSSSHLCGSGGRQARSRHLLVQCDLLALVVPPLALFVLVSSQLEFNHHVRYVLPVMGFIFVFSGITARWFQPGCD